jgi:hypothetical protein
VGVELEKLNKQVKEATKPSLFVFISFSVPFLFWFVSVTLNYILKT